jgi:hypothetical protein
VAAAGGHCIRGSLTATAGTAAAAATGTAAVDDSPGARPRPRPPLFISYNDDGRFGGGTQSAGSCGVAARIRACGAIADAVLVPPVGDTTVTTRE